MQNKLKRYAIVIRGKFQNIGYQGIIEGTARKMELKEYVFNDVDNSINNNQHMDEPNQRLEKVLEKLAAN